MSRYVKIEAFHQRPQQGFTPNVIVRQCVNWKKFYSYWKLTSKKFTSIVSPFICCGKGRVGGRTAIFSSLSRTISRDNEHFSRLLMVELNRTRNVSPLPIFRPGWNIYNCDEIMCKELYHILLIFVLSFLFWIWYVFLLYKTQFFCILRDIYVCGILYHFRVL